MYSTMFLNISLSLQCKVSHNATTPVCLTDDLAFPASSALYPLTDMKTRIGQEYFRYVANDRMEGDNEGSECCNANKSLRRFEFRFDRFCQAWWVRHNRLILILRVLTSGWHDWSSFSVRSPLRWTYTRMSPCRRTLISLWIFDSRFRLGGWNIESHMDVETDLCPCASYLDCQWR